MWLDKPAAEKTVVGHRALALHPDALTHAVNELANIGPAAAQLKVGAGEHLAALLLTAVCGTPVAIDTRGEVDLLFDRRAPDSRNWYFGNHDQAAVEVKSYAGQIRRVANRVQFGESPTFTLDHRPAIDILSDAADQIGRALDAVSRKTDEQTSKNVFLIIHPFDALATELLTEVALLGHVLPRLSPSVDLDTLWTLWHPGILTMWSREEQRWIEIFFAIDEDPRSRTNVDSLDPLQEAEQAFLAAIECRTDSPWLYTITVEGEGEELAAPRQTPRQAPAPQEVDYRAGDRAMRYADAAHRLSRGIRA